MEFRISRNAKLLIFAELHKSRAYLALTFAVVVIPFGVSVNLTINGDGRAK